MLFLPVYAIIVVSAHIAYGEHINATLPMPSFRLLYDNSPILVKRPIISGPPPCPDGCQPGFDCVNGQCVLTPCEVPSRRRQTSGGCYSPPVVSPVPSATPEPIIQTTTPIISTTIDPIITTEPLPPPPNITTYDPPPPPVITTDPPPPPPVITTEPPPPPVITTDSPPPPPDITTEPPPPPPDVTTTQPPPPPVTPTDTASLSPPPIITSTPATTAIISTSFSALSTTSAGNTIGSAANLSGKNKTTIQELSSTSPSYCRSDNSTLQVTNFRVVYNRFNNTIYYAMIVTAKEDGISPRVRAEARAYGFKAPAEDIELCNSGILSCPIQLHANVMIRGEHALDPNYYVNFPKHVWNMPDVDASVLFTFFSNDSNLEIACVQVSLTNGVTTQLQAIPWATGVVTIFIILASGAGGLAGYVVKGATFQPTDPSTHAATTTQAHAVGGDSGPPAQNMDPTTLFLHFQSISTSGLLSLKYPPIYQAFTVNFAWSNFILPLAAFRNHAKKMRKCDLDTPDSGGIQLSQLSLPAVSSSEASGGIPAYAAKLGISQQDIFGIAYFVFLCACAVLLGIFLLVGLAVQIASSMASDPERKEAWLERRTRWRQMSSNNSLRIMTLALGTLTTFAFYQLTQKCLSSITAFACASALILTMGPLAFVVFLILRLASKPGGIEHLFTKGGNYARRWGTLYDVLDYNRIFFVIPLLAVVVIRSAVVGFGQRNGLAQALTIIFLELTTCVALFKYRPYYSPGYNRVNYMLEGTRAFSHILLLTFVDKFNINPMAKNALGIVLLVVNSAVALVLVILTVLRLGWGVLWFRKKHIALQSEKEKAKQEGRHSASSFYDLESS